MTLKTDIWIVSLGAGCAGRPATTIILRRSIIVVAGFASIQWLRKNGVGVGFRLFNRPGELNRSFAKVLELTDKEFDALQNAVTEAREALVQSAVEVARVNVPANDSKLIVEVPSIAVRGSDIFRECLIRSDKRLAINIRILMSFAAMAWKGD